MIATKSYVCCKKIIKLDFICVLAKIVGYLKMIASLGSVWLQKTKVCDCKICWFISVTEK
jgi:hypothetical protein